ncbi:MAG: cytochrome P450 [Pseudonocardiaceae bacterium]|nr:cytochrome P450 [Pseudonocardiaceae bacterium]
MRDMVPTLEFDERFMQRPHETYRRLREQRPVQQVVLPRGTKVWVVTRYADVRALLTDSRLSKDVRNAGELFDRHAANGAVRTELRQSLGAHMLNSDPPDHTRLRKLVNKAFTSRTVERLRPRVEHITEELLDDMAGNDEVDLLESLAFPLPITVICELLGIPQGDRDDFRAWSNVIVSAGGQDELGEASAKMAGYLVELIKRKRRQPADDLLSELVHAKEDRDQLTDTELTSMAFLLLVAGHETTVNLIGNGMLALLRHPEQLVELRADRSLLPGAIEEFLRYEGPVHLATFRYTTEPLRLDEAEIGAGQFVMLSLLSANRDPDRFEDADGLDIRRPAGGHVAFGHGIHYCVGAPLARLEAEIAIGRLLDRFPELTLARQPETLVWRDSAIMRGLATLPIQL